MYAYSVECPQLEWEWTNNFQEAIDVWSEIRARYDKDAHIYVWPHVEEGKLYKRPSKSLINDYECCLRKRGFYV